MEETKPTCDRCRKTIEGEVINKTIIGRGRKQVYDSWKRKMISKAVVTQEPMKFCSVECASCEQMSREG